MFGFAVAGYTHKKTMNGNFSLSFILLLCFCLSWYLKSILLHSLFDILIGSSIDPPTADGLSHDVTNDFLVQGCICAIAASEKWTDTVWFVKILEKREADEPYTDNYSLTVAKGKKKIHWKEFLMSWWNKTQSATVVVQVRDIEFL